MATAPVSAPASTMGPAWKKLLIASISKQSNPKTATFVQLATVRADGTPANRTIVYRGFLDRNNTSNSTDMLFYTDTRSAKVEEVASNSAAELCWYMPDTWEQFRISGRAEVVGRGYPAEDLQKLRESCWQGLSDRQKATWQGGVPGNPRAPQPPHSDSATIPGDTMPGRREAHVEFPAGDGGSGPDLSKSTGTQLSHGAGDSGSGEGQGGPLDCFCLLLLEPRKVDYVSIKEDLRIVHTLEVGSDDAVWKSVDVNP